MEKALVICFCSLVLAGCATTKKDYSSSRQLLETATVVAKVTILVNGSQEDLQETASGICELTVSNEGDDKRYEIEKDGTFYLNTKPGVFYFKKLMCFTGIFSDSTYYFFPSIPTSVLTIIWPIFAEHFYCWGSFLHRSCLISIFRRLSRLMIPRRFLSLILISLLSQWFRSTNV